MQPDLHQGTERATWIRNVNAQLQVERTDRKRLFSRLCFPAVHHTQDLPPCFHNAITPNSIFEMSGSALIGKESRIRASLA